MVLLLVIFGPAKAAGMARDLGRFANEARRPLEEFKSELVLSEEVKEVRRSVEEFKDEAQRSVEELKTEVAVGEEESEPSSDIPPADEDEAREPQKGKELAREEEASPSEKEEEEVRPQEELEQRDLGSFDGFGGAKAIDTRSREHKTKLRPRWRRFFGG